MADYTSDRTGASIDQVLDNADTGGIGKTDLGSYGGNLDDITVTGFLRINASALNNPAASDGICLTESGSAGGNVEAQKFVSAPSSRMYFRAKYGSWSAWQELYHTGNTGLLNFSDVAPDGTVNEVSIGVNFGAVGIGNTGTGNTSAMFFSNSNGVVGSVTTSGTATAYNTSSDPRLKDFKAAPTDEAINAQFDSLFGCFRTFNWKSDPDGDLVWGFDAHACIDANLDMGSEGEGSRDLELGEVYKTDEAEFDEDGNETKAAIEHKVSPAGVDQSKAVPILLAKIEQLERRLKALEA